jgi:UPF0755 protein
MFKLIQKTLGIALLILFVIFGSIFGIGWFWWSTNSAPLDTKDTKLRDFEVISGDTFSSVATRLEAQKLIRSSLAFRVWHQLSSDGVVLQRGLYQISPSMDYDQIVKAFAAQQSTAVRITIREGSRVEQLAELFAAQLDNRTFRKDAFLKLAVPLEGTLFPDTYEFYANENAENVIQKLRGQFDLKYTQAKGPTDAKRKEEIIIIASLIEREGINAQDRRMISGIIRNRLDIDMALQIDATLQYVRDTQTPPELWWASPSPALKELDSPYNTYKYPGLPPGPIANPGYDSIIAALNPTESDYLYYLHAQGQAYYAKDYDQHQLNINRYLN